MKNYLSLIKFSHTIFAMPFALIGFTLGITHSSLTTETILAKLTCVLLCMVFARNAAMAFNRLVDKEIDAKNPRTTNRELPKNIISSKKALLFVLINCFLFAITTYYINFLCFYLFPITLFVILGYSYTKRFTFLSHFILGLSLSFVPLGAYFSINPTLNSELLFFSLVVLFWVAGFDIIYSLQDEGFDKENNLKSIPAFFGKKTATRFSLFNHIITSFLVIYIGILLELNCMYWGGSILFIASLAYQHFLINQYGLKKINIAFFITNGFASITYAIFVILSLMGV